MCSICVCFGVRVYVAMCPFFLSLQAALSSSTRAGWSLGNLTKCRNLCRKRIARIHLLAATYSPSLVDSVASGCRLHSHSTGAPANYTTNPLVGLCVSSPPADDASVDASKYGPNLCLVAAVTRASWAHIFFWSYMMPRSRVARR